MGVHIIRTLVVRVDFGCVGLVVRAPIFELLIGRIFVCVGRLVRATEFELSFFHKSCIALRLKADSSILLDIHSGSRSVR
jgi:hypothetical protein